MKRKSLRKFFSHLAIVGLSILAIDFFGCTPSEHSLRSKVVRIISPMGMCSGEQVRASSGESYILTASHCKELGVGGQYTVVTESGEKLQRKLIAEDSKSDLLLLEGLPGVKGLEIASMSYDEERVRAITHPKNHDLVTSDGQILEIKEVQIPLFLILDDADAQARCNMAKYKDVTVDSFFGPARVCLLDEFEQVTTAMIRPGSSGGPVVDSSGALVGVVSAGDGDGFGYLVTLSDIQNFLKGY